MNALTQRKFVKYLVLKISSIRTQFENNFQSLGAVYFITARVAKRAKVMFSQAFVCPSPGGGEDVTMGHHHPP